MLPRNKIILCLIVNGGVLLLVSILISIFAEESDYWRFGWSDNLSIIGVKINSMATYLALLMTLGIINIARVIVEELGMPVLQFSIYNPDKKIITEFTKNELNFYGNAMFLVSNLRNLLMTVVAVTQIDIAVWALLCSEITTFATVRMLLNEKTFRKDEPETEELTNFNDSV